MPSGSARPCGRCGGSERLGNGWCASQECREERSRAFKTVKRTTALTRKRDSALAKAGGADVLFHYVEEGLSFSQMCAELGLENSAGMRNALRHVVRSDPERYEEAKRNSVDALAEKAGEPFDGAVPATSAHAKHNNDKSQYLRWLAELRGGYLDKGGPSVQIDIGSLHLDALKAHGHRNPDQQRRVVPSASAAFLDAQDAEVIE